MSEQGQGRRVRAGRAWTWEGWERKAPPRRGNYATASKASAGLFVALLGLAMAMKHVAPTPAELSASPLASAQRGAAKTVFALAYLPECEQEALRSIEEPYRSLASAWGAYQPAAFPKALACLDEKLAQAGLAPLRSQLLSAPDGALLDLDCGGELRDSEACAQAFALAAKRSKDVGESLGWALSGGAPAERRAKP